MIASYGKMLLSSNPGQILFVTFACLILPDEQSTKSTSE
jgi:hypothetical protein